MYHQFATLAFDKLAEFTTFGKIVHHDIFHVKEIFTSSWASTSRLPIGKVDKVHGIDIDPHPHPPW